MNVKGASFTCITFQCFSCINCPIYILIVVKRGSSLYAVYDRDLFPLSLVFKESRPRLHCAAYLHNSLSLLPPWGRPVFQLLLVPQTSKYLPNYFDCGTIYWQKWGVASQIEIGFVCSSLYCHAPESWLLAWRELITCMELFVFLIL